MIGPMPPSSNQLTDIHQISGGFKAKIAPANSLGKENRPGGGHGP
jgi:hypothetical protein